jgi:hypothetical protein
MNVTEEEFRAYINLFHSTLETTAQTYLAEDIRKQLLHYSLTPARIIGYVSTQFGLAIEYQPSESLEIEIHRGGARVEDLFVQAPPALRNVGPLMNIGGSGTRIYGITFSGAFPFRLTRQEANVSFGDSVFEAKKWRRTVHYAEVYGDRTRELWLPEKAVSRAKDEVLAAIVEARQAQEKHITIEQFIGESKKKMVLVLGDYDNTSLARLELIAQLLRKLGYEPLLLRDIPDHPYQDLRQKVVAIGAISRFIVVDDSSKSGHLLEVQLCDQNRWITILLHANGQIGSWITVGASHLSNVIHEQPYDPLSPELALGQATTWAEQKLQELEIKFNNTYPWRMRATDPPADKPS